MPSTHYEEGTEIVVDSEALALETGFTDDANSTVTRLGEVVLLALRVKSDGAHSHVCTLPPEYRPKESFDNPGSLEIEGDGKVEALDEAKSVAGHYAYQVIYRVD